MTQQATRRGFLGAAAGVAGLLVGGNAVAEVSNDLGGFKLGITIWSVREFQRALAIEMIKQLETPYVSVKEFHLPYRSTTAELIAGRKEFENAGLRIMAGGTITLAKDDPADMRKYFDYAKPGVGDQWNVMPSSG